MNWINPIDASERLQRRMLDFFYGVGPKPLSPADCQQIAASVLESREPIVGVDWNEVANRWNWEKDRLIGCDFELPSHENANGIATN